MSDVTPPAPAPEPTQNPAAAPAPATAPAPAPVAETRDPSGPPRPAPRAPGGTGRGQGGRPPMPRGERPRQDVPQVPPPKLADFGASKPKKRELDRSIEDELAAAMASMDVVGALSAAEVQKKPVAAATAMALPGGRKRGTVLSVHGKDVFIEIPGGRGQGVLPILQFEGRIPTVGEEVEFAIERYDSANGLLVLTREGAVQSVTDWSSVALHMIVEVKVTGVNKNRTGLQVEVNGIKGFMPISQIDLYRVEQPEQFINQKLKCEIIELNKEERNLIVSRKALMERERNELKEQFWATLQEGQAKSGIVSSIQKFGVFVNLGACDGLIPMSELSWQRVNDASEIVQIGQKVDVVVHRLDRETRKIALSLKQLHANPWDDFTRNNRSGSRITGKVTRTTEFGAFVELEAGIEGLIHISELSTQRVRKVTEVVQVGQTVSVQILNIDPAQRRIGLSLKTIMAGEEAVAEAAEEAERQADLAAATERMATRSTNPNLRGGTGNGKPLFDLGGKKD